MEVHSKIKILIWGTGIDYSINLIRILSNMICESENNMSEDYEIVGITSNQNIKGSIDNIPFIHQNEVLNVNFDYIIVTPNKYFNEINSMAIKMKIDPNKIILQDIIKLPGFKFDKYKKLRESKLSIISQNCFGGMLYHRFKLQFLSPTINLFIKLDAFLKMISDLKCYMNYKIKFKKADYNKASGLVFPIFNLGDIELFMIHYNDFVEAEEKWNERVQRINWENLLIVTTAKSEKELEIFDSLPYEKKACFVQFKSDLKSAFYLPPNLNDHKDVYQNAVAAGRYPYYDLWDLMLYGKKTPRMDFDYL